MIDTARHKVDVFFIVDDSENHVTNMYFLNPIESYITTKKTKIYVTTQNDVTTIEPDQMVVKGRQNRIIFLSSRLFSNLFSIKCLISQPICKIIIAILFQI